jgi:hypothetical protein
VTGTIAHVRAEHDRRRIDHEDLTDVEAFHLGCARQRRPRRRPETPGHPADLRDGGPAIDSVILMAIVRRHFLPLPDPRVGRRVPRPAARLAGEDVARAQVVLDEVQAMLGRREAPLGVAWWKQSPSGRGV